MKHLENEDLNDLIKTGVHLVDFYAEWCGPCKMLSPVLESISNEISIIKVNIDTHETLTQQYRIMSVPTLIFFKDGNKINEVSGYRTKEELLNIINQIKSTK